MYNHADILNLNDTQIKILTSILEIGLKENKKGITKYEISGLSKSLKIPKSLIIPGTTFEDNIDYLEKIYAVKKEQEGTKGWKKKKHRISYRYYLTVLGQFLLAKHCLKVFPKKKDLFAKLLGIGPLTYIDSIFKGIDNIPLPEDAIFHILFDTYQNYELRIDEQEGRIEEIIRIDYGPSLYFIRREFYVGSKENYYRENKKFEKFIKEMDSYKIKIPSLPKHYSQIKSKVGDRFISFCIFNIMKAIIDPNYLLEILGDEKLKIKDAKEKREFSAVMSQIIVEINREYSEYEKKKMLTKIAKLVNDNNQFKEYFDEFLNDLSKALNKNSKLEEFVNYLKKK